jgi:hypothetical protein
MNSEEKVPPHIVRLAKRFRFTGWWFLLLGTPMCIYQIAILFNPEATIPVNGVPTKDFVTKLSVAAFVSIFPVIGAILAITPKKLMQGKLVSFDRWAKGFGRQLLDRK